MMILIRTLASALSQAWQQLTGNKLRTALSLLGVSIGIFCIVAVQSAVDSLQANVMGSLAKMGDETFYVQKMPWGGGGDYPWWKYNRRPAPRYDEYEALARDLDGLGEAGYYAVIGGRTAKWRSRAVEGIFSVAGSPEAAQFFGFEFAEGRYFTPADFAYRANAVVLGADVARDLFGGVDAVGREIRMLGQKITVVGVLEKSGEDLLQVFNFDGAAIFAYPFLAKAVNLESDWFFSSLMARPTGGADKQAVRDAVTVSLRGERRLRPTEEDDFALNNLSILSGFLDQMFSILTLVGYVIGGFAIFVGGFSVANIMFVSVQERTNLIGVKMALGAPRPVILLEFLIESIALCFIGGGIGLALVWLAQRALNSLLPYEMGLSAGNVFVGFALATLIGVVSGVVPALKASRMDPVTAISS